MADEYPMRAGQRLPAKCRDCSAEYLIVRDHEDLILTPIDGVPVESSVAAAPFLTMPHAQHLITVEEDHEDHEMRIYRIQDRFKDGEHVKLLGSELQSIAEYAAAEKARRTVEV